MPTLATVRTNCPASILRNSQNTDTSLTITAVRQGLCYCQLSETHVRTSAILLAGHKTRFQPWKDPYQIFWSTKRALASTPKIPPVACDFPSDNCRSSATHTTRKDSQHRSKRLYPAPIYSDTLKYFLQIARKLSLLLSVCTISDYFHGNCCARQLLSRIPPSRSDRSQAGPNNLLKMALSLSNYLYAICLAFSYICTAATVTYDFNATWITANPDGQFGRSVIGLNGQWPIPTIHVTVGDQLIVNLHNGLGNVSTSLHFHGLFQNGTTNMDGATGVSQCLTPPGSTFTYNFTVCSYHNILNAWTPRLTSKR